MKKKTKSNKLKNSKNVDMGRRVDNYEELNEILKEINDQFNGILTESDRVMMTTLVVKTMSEDELKEYARKNDRQVYVHSIFPEFFEKIAMDCYLSQMDAFKKLYENKDLYNVIMNTIANESFKDFNRSISTTNVV